MNYDAVTGVPFDLNTLYSLLRDHAGLAILAILLFLVYRYAGDIGAFFKDYFNKKIDSETKRVEEIQKQNDKYFTLYENNTEAVKKVGEAINSFEKAFIVSEARTSEKILNVESRLGEKILGVETRLTDKIANVVHHGKIDKLTSLVQDKLNDGDDSDNGDPK